MRPKPPPNYLAGYPVALVVQVQQLIEPMLTVVLGCLLGWIMLSVLGPVYDVISKIKT